VSEWWSCFYFRW